MKKEPKVIYGIEIKKPFSKEMYAHNDEVAENMRIHLRAEIINTYRRAFSTICNNCALLNISEIKISIKGNLESWADFLEQIRRSFRAIR